MNNIQRQNAVKTLLDLVVHEQCDESLFCEVRPFSIPGSPAASLNFTNGRSFYLRGMYPSSYTYMYPSSYTCLPPQERGGQQLCAQVLLYPLTDYYLPAKPSFLTYDSGIYGVGFSGSCCKLGWDLLGDHILSLCVRYTKALGLHQM